MKKAHALYSFFVCLVIVTLLSACAGTAAPAALNCATVEDFCVGLVTQEGKLNDQGLNQLTWDGIQRAEQKLGISIQYIETVDSRDYEKNIAAFANAGYDLIVTVGYSQMKASIAAARKYPQVNFIGVDQPLDPDRALPQNLMGLYFAEDQLGFLAGVLAAQMTKTNKVGAVCGPDSFPPAWRYCEGFKAGVEYINHPPEPEPTAEPTGEEPPSEEPTEEPLEEEPTEEPFEEEPTEEPEEIFLASHLARQAPPQEAPPVEATLLYHNEIAFNDSLADPEWDARMATALISEGVDVIFGADSYGENGAVSAAAQKGVYAIGVNIDQYLTLPDAQAVLLTSVVKQVTAGVFDMIKAARYGEFPGGNFLGAAGYAPYHDLGGRVPKAVKASLVEIQQGLADGSIETGVFEHKP